jgi:hypothetical protein
VLLRQTLPVAPSFTLVDGADIGALSGTLYPVFRDLLSVLFPMAAPTVAQAASKVADSMIVRFFIS